MDTPETPAATTPRVPLATLAKVFATPDRIRILGELAKGEALMTKELARINKQLPSMTSKHMRVLRESGIVLRGLGNLYAINPIYSVPGKPGHVDLGTCLFRLDTDS